MRADQGRLGVITMFLAELKGAVLYLTMSRWQANRLQTKPGCSVAAVMRTLIMSTSEPSQWISPIGVSILETFSSSSGKPSFIHGRAGQWLGKSGMVSSTFPNRKAKRHFDRNRLRLVVLPQTAIVSFAQRPLGPTMRPQTRHNETSGEPSLPTEISRAWYM